MSSKSLSFVIPVYNVEKTVEKCLQSVLQQTFQDIEVICVNDGSTDGSLSILETFRSDPRVTIVSQPNQGLSAARNAGLARAQGEFISFVDSDDYLHPQYAEILTNALRRHPQADCALFDLAEVAPTFAAPFQHYEDVPETVYVDLFNDFFDFEAQKIEACRFMYRRDRLKNLRFVPRLRYEDVEFTPRFLREAHQGVRVKAVLYYYVQWPKSISHSQITPADVHYFYWILRRLDRLYADNASRQKRLRQEFFPCYFVLCSKRLRKAKKQIPDAEWNHLRETLRSLIDGFIPMSAMKLGKRWPLRWKLRFLYAQLWSRLHPQTRRACESAAQAILPEGN